MDQVEQLLRDSKTTKHKGRGRSSRRQKAQSAEEPRQAHLSLTSQSRRRRVPGLGARSSHLMQTGEFVLGTGISLAAAGPDTPAGPPLGTANSGLAPDRGPFWRPATFSHF